MVCDTIKRVVITMQREQSNRKSRLSRFSRTSKVSRTSMMSSLWSPERFSDRKHSLSNRVSLVEAMDIEAPEAQRGSGIMSDADRRQSEKRESVNYLTEDYSFLPEIKENDLVRKSTYKTTHECNCDEDECLGVHCVCFLTPREICMIGSCCPSCIQAKNEFLMATRGWQLQKAKKNQEVKLDEGFLALIKQKNVKNMHYLKQIYANEPTMQNLVFCTCKKSHCQKKYCLCFEKGVLCGEYCGCLECENIQRNSDQQEKEEQSRWERYANYIPNEQEESAVDPDIDKFMQQQLREDNFSETMQFDPPNFQKMDHE